MDLVGFAKNLKKSFVLVYLKFIHEDFKTCKMILKLICITSITFAHIDSSDVEIMLK